MDNRREQQEGYDEPEILRQFCLTSGTACSHGRTCPRGGLIACRRLPISLLYSSVEQRGIEACMLRPKPILYVALCDRDQWAVEAEWPDGTLERINTFNDHSSATDWIATQSDVWLKERHTPNEYPLRKPE